MLALRSAPPVFGIAEGERIARDVYGLAVELLPLSGERDCNFHARTADGREFVLKIVDGAADPHATACQAAVLRHLAEQDPSLPVPRLYATLEGADIGRVVQDEMGYDSCLLSYLPGELLTDAVAGAGLLRHVGATLGRVDRALRGFFHPALAQHIAWDVRRLPELAEFSSHIASADLRGMVRGVISGLDQRLPALRALRSQAIHGDSHGGNLLIGGTPTAVCGVLDFGDMIHAPVVMEPAVSIAELLMEGVAEPEIVSAVLEGYTGVQALDPADVDVLFDLVTARHATTVLVHAWRVQHDAAGARVLEKMSGNAGPSLEWLLTRGRER